MVHAIIADEAAECVNTHTASDPPIWHEQTRGLAVDATQEQWRPVVDWEAFYEVSDQGRVRSKDRVVSAPNQYGKVRRYFKPGRMLVQSGATDRKYPTVHLCQDGARLRAYVHRLVLEAFVGPAPEGAEACHADDDPSNNLLTNLRWDSHRNNSLDITRNGNNHHANKSRCIHGHEFSPENTHVYRNGWRRCRRCW